MPRLEPFLLDVPDSALEDLDARLAATRFAPDVDNADGRYGVSTDRLRELVSYWRSGYDWRAQEKAINQLPMYLTEVQGQRIHFVHVRGRGPSPRPLLLSHGFPWTF